MLKAIGHIVIALLCCYAATAQDFRDLKDVDPQEFKSQRIPTIELEDEKEEEKEDNLKNRREENKTKIRKRWYYGMKTKRGYTEEGYGRRRKLKLFRYLKEYRKPDPYIKDIYWYDISENEIKHTSIEKIEKNKEDARILHGKFKIMEGGVLIKEGWFYVGTKHGRWVEYKKPKEQTFKDSIKIETKPLKDKTVYHLGRTVESKVTYYDADRKKVKEVIPYKNGQLQGDYYYFYENGTIKIEGEYEAGFRVGRWEEFQRTDRGRYVRKRVIKYPHQPFSDEEPYIMRLYDENGKMIYNHRQHRNEPPKPMEEPLDTPPPSKSAE